MFRGAVFAAMLAVTTGTARAEAPDPYASGMAQQAAMSAGRLTSERLVAAELKRIAAMDRRGPRLNSIIALNRHALADARALDGERRAGQVRGPLHGLPILLKDNIEAGDFAATTAGSLALAANRTGRNGPVAGRLTAAGAIILGKTNLSEWANFRSPRSISGWSAVGGLTRNPFALDRTPWGSSAGSAAAVAAGFAFAALGTETDGSIICPAAANGVVGFKPTLGLVSRRLIVPLSPEQDTAGPIARTVADAATVLTVIAGSDPEDAATAGADAHRTNYAAALDAGALKGARIGVLRGVQTGSPKTDIVFDQALEVLKAQGAILVEIKPLPKEQSEAIGAAEGPSLRAEFKAAIETYLATAPPGVEVRTLDQLLAFNRATPAETALFGQENFEAAATSPSLTDPVYREARAAARRLAGPEGLDRMMGEADVEAIVAESGAPASVVDLVNGVKFLGSPSQLPAVAGYPHLTVPMGQVDGLPVGLSIIGPAWSDARVLSLGYAFEQASHAWRAPTYAASVDSRPEILEEADAGPP